MYTKSHKLARAFCATATSSVGNADVTGTKSDKYQKMCERLKEISQLSGASSILGWDEQTMMPAGAAAARGQQKAALAAVIHEKQTSTELKELIQELKNYESSNPYEEANIRDAKRDFDLENSKSKEIARVYKEAEMEAECFNAWLQARKADDWESFEPKLKEMFELRKKVSQMTRPELSTYNGALDAFERGMPAERLDAIFDTVKKDLLPLVKSVINSPSLKLPAALTDTEWDVELQSKLCLEVARSLGFDMDRGRFDVSAHPFTGGAGPLDVRITTRYNPKNWKEGIGGTIHEVGHALYEQGRSTDQLDLPVSRALSMGVHESQSLLWERMVFQGRPFWEWATPIVHKYFPHTKDVTADDFYRAVNAVEPGLIRTEADELTYPLHIFLRFELEKGLFEGQIPVSELPKIWRMEMKKSLGLDVPNDADGVLQDVHWSVGAIGYFPSYSLGAMMAAQFYNTAKEQIDGLEDEIAKGNFKPLVDWLNEKIHRVGSLYPSPDQLLEAVTGKPLDPSAYCDYLKEKYTKLYGLE